VILSGGRSGITDNVKQKLLQQIQLITVLNKSELMKQFSIVLLFLCACGSNEKIAHNIPVQIRYTDENGEKQSFIKYVI
jgi:hypothetical protein